MLGNGEALGEDGLDEVVGVPAVLAGERTASPAFAAGDKDPPAVPLEGDAAPDPLLDEGEVVPTAGELVPGLTVPLPLVEDPDPAKQDTH